MRPFDLLKSNFWSWGKIAIIDDDDCFYCYQKRGFKLVPLIEGLCAQILYSWIEIIGGLRSHLLLFFFKKKYVKEKKQLVQDLILPPSIYIHMCTLYTYTNTYMPRFSPSGFFEPPRCLIPGPTPGFIPEYPICAVCVCVYVSSVTHTYTHIHSHLPWK